MRVLVASLAASAALIAGAPAVAADPPPGGRPAGTAANPAPQVKGKPAPRATKPKRTRTTIPPAKPKKG
jgi:hypothetical protein